MKAGILGMGRMGQIHANVYASLGVEECRVHDPRFPENYTEDEVIEWADIVSICSPDNFHTQQIIKAFRANKTVFCEKPLCHTKRELMAIEGAWNQQKFSMNFPLRWCLPFAEVKCKDFGKIYLIEADYEYGRRGKFEGWRGDMDYSGIMGGGLHMIDLVTWMTGLPISEGRTQYCGHSSVSIAQLGGGGILKLTCDFGGNKKHAHRLRICGTSDQIYIENTEPTDKGRALHEFIRGEEAPTPEEVFSVHDIGLNL